MPLSVPSYQHGPRGHWYKSLCSSLCLPLRCPAQYRVQHPLACRSHPSRMSHVLLPTVEGQPESRISSSGPGPTPACIAAQARLHLLPTFDPFKTPLAAILASQEQCRLFNQTLLPHAVNGCILPSTYLRRLRLPTASSEAIQKLFGRDSDSLLPLFQHHLTSSSPSLLHSLAFSHTTLSH